MASKMLFFFGFIFPIFLFFGDVTNGRELDGKTEWKSFQEASSQLIQPSSFSSKKYVETIELLAAYNSNKDTAGTYYGVMATLILYGEPELQSGQTSGAFVSLHNSKDGVFKPKEDIIKAGWTVDPEKYGDTSNHFFTYWKAGDSGCMDLDCTGFVVQNGSNLAPGNKLEMVYDITIKLFKDPDTGDWWIHTGQNGNLSPVGYFPKSLFSRLVDQATFFQVGGAVTFKDYLTSPAMGSGRFPSDGTPAAASIKEVRLVDQAGEPFIVQESLQSWLDYKDCYGLGSFDTDHFLYGGPGGCKA